MPQKTKRRGLKVLPEYRNGSGIPAFALRRWNAETKQYEWVAVPITESELTSQKERPVRLSHEPKYWLYRDRFVLQEGVESVPDVLVDILETVAKSKGVVCRECGRRELRWLGRCPGCGTWESFIERQPPLEQATATRPRIGMEQDEAQDVETFLAQANAPVWWTGWQLTNYIRSAKMGIFPTRHSVLVRNCPEELALRVKHAVLTEQRAIEKLKREVALFENFEKLEKAALREPIPQHVQMFVWQRDQGRCVRCGCQERLEYDHIIPLVKGGSNTERNIQLLCESCNRSKGGEI